jgi:DNA polymerase III sliding clamp (beta) subunit (PCNA family)
VIPKDNERAFTVSRLAFLDALKRVALMSSDKTFGVRLALDKGKVRVESDNPDLGAAKEEIDVNYKGTAVQIGFNARYFMDLLAEIETPEVRVELSGELDPAVVRPADGGDRHPRRQFRAEGGRRRHLGEADRRAVPALRPGHPQGQRPRVRGVAAVVP